MDAAMEITREHLRRYIRQAIVETVELLVGDANDPTIEATIVWIEDGAVKKAIGER
jgi:hypothetical protein